MIPNKSIWDEWTDKIFKEAILERSGIMAHGKYLRHQKAYPSGFETLTADVAIETADLLYERLKEWEDSLRSST